MITVQSSKTSHTSMIRNIDDFRSWIKLLTCTLCRFEVFEDAAAITDIGGVNATDIDSGDLGDVQYSIFPSDKSVPLILHSSAPVEPDSFDRFGVNPSTGRVFTRVTLNREEQSNYTVNIIATDQDPVIASRKSQTVVATIIGMHV